MPKLYEYMGLYIMFYANYHEPIHVHCKYQDTESKAEILFENGKFKEILIKDVTGKTPLNNNNLRKFKNLVENYRFDIVRKWIDFFIYNVEIKSEVINKKLW